MKPYKSIPQRLNESRDKYREITRRRDSGKSRRPDIECHDQSGCWNCRPDNLEFGDVCVPWNGVGTPSFMSLWDCVSSGCNIGNNPVDMSFP